MSFGSFSQIFDSLMEHENADAEHRLLGSLSRLLYSLDIDAGRDPVARSIYKGIDTFGQVVRRGTGASARALVSLGIEKRTPFFSAIHKVCERVIEEADGEFYKRINSLVEKYQSERPLTSSGPRNLQPSPKDICSAIDAAVTGGVHNFVNLAHQVPVLRAALMDQPSWLPANLPLNRICEVATSDAQAWQTTVKTEHYARAAQRLLFSAGGALIEEYVSLRNDAHRLARVSEQVRQTVVEWQMAFHLHPELDPEECWTMIVPDYTSFLRIWLPENTGIDALGVCRVDKLYRLLLRLRRGVRPARMDLGLTVIPGALPVSQWPPPIPTALERSATSPVQRSSAFQEDLPPTEVMLVSSRAVSSPLALQTERPNPFHHRAMLRRTRNFARNKLFKRQK